MHGIGAGNAYVRVVPAPEEPVTIEDRNQVTYGAAFSCEGSVLAELIPLIIEVDGRAPGVIRKSRLRTAYVSRNPEAIESQDRMKKPFRLYVGEDLL